MQPGLQKEIPSNARRVRRAAGRHLRTCAVGVVEEVLLRGSCARGDGSRFINQLHPADIAAAPAHLLGHDARAIFNGSDDGPMTQRAVDDWLAQHSAKPLPLTRPIDPNRNRAWTSKHVGNSKLRASGWPPRHLSSRDAVKTDPTLLQPPYS